MGSGLNETKKNVHLALGFKYRKARDHDAELILIVWVLSENQPKYKGRGGGNSEGEGRVLSEDRKQNGEGSHSKKRDQR